MKGIYHHEANMTTSFLLNDKHKVYSWYNDIKEFTFESSGFEPHLRDVYICVWPSHFVVRSEGNKSNVKYY